MLRPTELNQPCFECLPDVQVSGGRTQYFFRSTGTTQITLPEGDNFFSFESGQKERHFADGSRRIVFPNGSIKWI